MSNDEFAKSCLSLPDDAPMLVRKALGLPHGAPLRIAYVCGPGDAVGTFEHWMRGMHDPRTPVIAYSAMFYSLVESLDARALLLVEQDRQPNATDPRFSFVHTAHPRGRRGLDYRRDQAAFTRSVLQALSAWPADVIVVGTDAPASLVARLPRESRIVLTAHNVFWPMGAVHGVPSVVSSIVPARDLLDGACQVFPANDVEALTEILRSLAGDRAALRAHSEAALAHRPQFLDRSRSWGSQLYKAILA
ncbi:hypothetical protein [Hydrogenophaga sp. IBVHS1]|uniref:hypothetical protein n=1 Tax=unclassified Hydrogenophaga TaxID=2610897 RepID=UPI000A2DAF4A|nr:hypothetical protein [Hydrogenophaga sp. IBVHS1]OSZ75428.1 hypothetical protein CAP37_08425 [Hydrogenophaga sp. IBVHS1]